MRALRAARAALARCAAFPFGYYAVSIAGSAVFAGGASSALRRARYAMGEDERARARGPCSPRRWGAAPRPPGGRLHGEGLFPGGYREYV